MDCLLFMRMEPLISSMKLFTMTHLKRILNLLRDYTLLRMQNKHFYYIKN